MSTAPLLAFGFGHLAMLGWLGAAAAPLLIHLWNRRRHRETEWAAMEWLLAALRKNARRIRIEQWILLAVRTLMIVCVVLAFAEPYLERMGLSAAGGDRAHKLIVLDGSFSMASTVGEKSYFERAKELAEQIVENGAEGDAHTLLLMTSPPRAVVATPSFDVRDVLQEIETLKLPHGGMDLVTALTKAEEILRRAVDDHPRFARQEVFFLTDLQRVGWLAESRSASAGESRRLAARLARLARLHIVDLADYTADNLAVANLRVSEPVVTADRETMVEVAIHNFGRQACQAKLELVADGREIAETTISAEADADGSASFPYRFETPGEHVLEARLGGDALEIDNHRWLSVPVRQAIHVLCVNGRPGGDFGQATDYLAVALAPQSDGPRASVRPEVISESQFVETELSDFDSIFLCNVGQFTAAESRLLRDYLRSGGGVVIFLGDQVQAASYNRFLGGEEPNLARILPARIGPIAPAGDYRVDPLGYRHPLLSIFRDQEQAGLITAPVHRYFRLTPDRDSQAQVAIGVSSGDAVVVEAPIERGRVILIGTSADASWNMMPLLPSYVPLVHELLHLSLSGRSRERNVEVNQPIESPVTGPALAPIAVESPSGERHEARIAGGDPVWQYADTQYSGVYAVDFDNAQPRKLFAVNVNTRESDLSRLSPDELRHEVWPSVDFDVHTGWHAAAESPVVAKVQPGKLNLILLYTALALVLTEPVLAWFFRQRRG